MRLGTASPGTSSARVDSHHASGGDATEDAPEIVI
jgi:hypothetical protein